MNISDKILKLKNKIYAKAILDVSVEGDLGNSYPDKCNIVNKKTGKKWLVEFCSKPRRCSDSDPRDDWYAELKDEKGQLLEKAKIFQYSDGETADKIWVEESGYAPLWNAVNSEFKKFQTEHRRIRAEENQMRQNAERVSSMKKLESFLKQR